VGGTRKAVGTVRKLGLEGGVWALVTDSGETIELLGAPDALLVDGRRAEVELDATRADVTIGMTGASGRVKGFKIV